MKKSEVPWAKKIDEALSVAWQSPGGVSVESWDDDKNNSWTIILTPVSREMVGGEQDGMVYYPPFSCNINKFIRAVFDKPPKIAFRAAGEENTVPHIAMRGKIDGNLCQISILGSPIPNRPAVEVAYNIGPKKGTVERRPPEDCEEVKDDE
jgi:hypothetical protein